METSASEIANYKGNAAAALGSTSGADASPIFGQTDATRISARGDAVAEANNRKNMILYEQQVRDRDMLYKAIGDGKLSVNQMLPGDRNKVLKQYLEPVQKMLMEHPDIQSKPQEWVKFTEAQGKLNEANKYGQARFTLIKGMDDKIAAETDPQKRQRMIDHRNKTEAQDLFDEVKPYQQQLDFGDEIYIKPTAKVQSNQAIRGDEVIDIASSHTPVKDFIRGTMYNYIDSPNKTIKDQMDLFGNQVHDMDNEAKAKLAEQWNDVIAQAMHDENLNEKSEDWIAPINVTTDEQGNVTIAEIPQRMVLAQSLLKNYDNSTKTVGKISNLPSTLRKAEADIKQTLYETKFLLPAKVNTEYARQAKLRADTDKARQETIKVTKENQAGEKSGDYVINTLIGMFDPNKTNTLPDVKDLPEFARSKGISGKVLVGDGEKGGKYSVLTPIEMSALSRPVKDEEGKTVMQEPDRVIQNTQNPKDPYLISIFYPKDIDTGERDKSKNGDIVVSRPQKLIEPLIKGYIGPSATGNEYKIFDNVVNRYKERANSQNFNATIMGMVNNPDYAYDPNFDEDTDTPPAPAAKTAAKPAPAKPVSDSTLNKKKNFFGKLK